MVNLFRYPAEYFHNFPAAQRMAALWKPLGALLSIAILASPTLTGQGVSFHAQYLNLGPGGVSNALATDSAGNHFIVSTVTEPSGTQQMRATKTDAQGKVLASFDFGGGSDTVYAATADAQGSLIVAGTTRSRIFPNLSTPANPGLAFVIKLDSALSKVLASRILGGKQPAVPVDTVATALTVDAGGNVYVTGSTGAADLPVTSGAYQTTAPAQTNLGFPAYAFLLKLSPNLNQVVFGTYFGSSGTACSGGSACIGKVGITSTAAIALDSADNVVIAGSSNADGLPVTSGAYAGNCACNAYRSAGFVSKFSADGSRLIWSTFLPANSTRLQFMMASVQIDAVAFDGGGNVVLAGAAPDGFPVTSGVVQGAYPVSGNAADFTYAGFVARLDSAGANLLDATYFGAGSSRVLQSLAIDAANSIWITGTSDAIGALPGAPASLGTTYIANLSADLSSVALLQTAPSGAAGQVIHSDPSGTVTVLGSQGSLLLSGAAGTPSVVAVANTAGSAVSGTIAPAEIVSFYGYNLGPTPALNAQVSNGVVANSVNGYQVLFNGVAAPLLYMGLNQVNCVVPAQLAGLDTATVEIVTPQGQTMGPTLFLAQSQPAIFHTRQGSYPALPLTDYALALNQDQTVNSASNPAAPGSVVSVWVSGAGPDGFSPPDGTILPNVGNQDLPLLVSVLGSRGSLEVLYAGDAPGGVYGLIQVNFRLPASFLRGDPTYSIEVQVGPNASPPVQIYVHG